MEIYEYHITKQIKLKLKNYILNNDQQKINVTFILKYIYYYRYLPNFYLNV